MKAMQFLQILLVLVCLFSLTGCSEDEVPGNKVEMIKMDVSAETKINSFPGSSEPIEYLLAKEEKESEYRTFGFLEIRGFQYEKGYEYKLLVEKTTLINPPADGSDVRYRLIEVLSKR